MSLAQPPFINPQETKTFSDQDVAFPKTPTRIVSNQDCTLSKPATSRTLENLISQKPGSRRGSLAQTRILENAILELPENLGSGSRRGSLADIIPDWPTLKPFRLEPETHKVSLGSTLKKSNNTPNNILDVYLKVRIMATHGFLGL